MITNIYQSFLISGFAHILLAGIYILMPKPDYNAAQSLDVSFLFSEIEKKAQSYEEKSKKLTSFLTSQKNTNQYAMQDDKQKSDKSHLTQKMPFHPDSEFSDDKTISLPAEGGAFIAKASASGKGADTAKSTGVEPALNDVYLTPVVKEDVDMTGIIGSLINRIEAAKQYPYIARKKGIEGTVVLKIKLNRDGNLLTVLIKRSSGFGILDESALSLIKKVCPFRHNAGRDIAIELPIRYSLVKQ